MQVLQKFVGSQVRVFRDRKGISQIELAERISVSKETIGKIERGAAAPSFRTLDKLCRELRISPRYLFPAEKNESGEPASTALEKLVSKASKMTDAELEWVLSLIEEIDKRP